MSAKTQINAALTRLTGHHLAKGAPGEQLGVLHRQLAQSQQELRQARQELRQAQQAKQAAVKTAKAARLAAKIDDDGFPKGLDDAAKDIIRAVRPYTMTDSEKLYGLIQSVRYVTRYGIAGDIVECGVWRGGSMQAAARTLLEVGDTSRDLYLFDTFEGMTEPTEFDVRFDGKPAAELLEAKDRTTNVWAVASLEDVQDGFTKVPYPQDKVHFLPGKVEDTIPAELPEQVAILRLDTDWYESTKHELEHAYSRLSPGGVLIIDDYAHWVGSKKATDEFIAASGEALLTHRLGGGRIAVKPFTQNS